MREVEFRARDRHDKEWVYFKPGYLVLFKDGTLQQWTGLEDKNGVRIYEGDILRIPAKDEYEKTTYNSFEVFWHDNDATPTDCGLVLGRLKAHGHSAGGYSGYKLIPRDVSRMEIIGNIYENPELLTKGTI